MSVGQKTPGPAAATLEFVSAGRTDWEMVEELLAFLARSRAVFPTASSTASWISNYEPGKSLVVESGDQSRRVQVEHVKACWETFERLGRIHRTDVLDPGRCSAFMMALFEQLPGVSVAERGARLVLPPSEASSTRLAAR
jgi:hypothetical protein